MDLPRWSGSQRRIGITGGVATGKTTIGNFLKEEKKLPILDLDVYSRELLSPKTSLTEIIINRYGKLIINSNERHLKIINREALGDIIFSDKKEKVWIENLLHPIIKEKLLKDLESMNSLSTIIIIIPLLFEAKLTSICSEIWVVSCDQNQQIERLKNRDKLTNYQAEIRINSQLKLDEKIKLADVIIDNSGGSEIWKSQIQSLL